MNFKQNKIAVLVIAILLTSSVATSIAFMPTTSAHTPAWLIPTFPHIYVATDPIGVGQKAFVYCWVAPTYADTLITNAYRFHNWTLQIVAPNGAVTTQHFDTIQDTTSSTGTTFVPDQVGVYNLTLIVPPQAVNDYSHSLTSQFINDTYMGGTASTSMTVQQDAIPEITYPPLPTEYWTRPIFGTNSPWWSITSNWLGSGVPGYAHWGSAGPNELCFSGQSVGSQTSHIMWTKSIGQTGGVVGGQLAIPGETFFEGTAYSQRYTNPIIANGMIVYREPFETTGTAGDTVCVNLFTGAEIWRSSTLPSMSFAYVQDMNNPDFHGARPVYLCASNFGSVWDMATGKNVMNATGVPSGTTWVGPDGEIMKYIFYNNASTGQPQDYYLCQWNSSRWWNSAAMGERSFLTTTTTTTGNTSSTTYTNGVLTTILTPYSTATVTVPANKAYMYDFLDSVTQNVSISWRNNQAGSPSIVAVLPGDLLLCRNGSYPGTAPTGNLPYNYFAVNLNSSVAAIGKVLWWNTVQPFADPVYGNVSTANLAAAVSFAGATPSGFSEAIRATQQIKFFDIRTGEFVKLSDPQPSLDFYGSTSAGNLVTVAAFDRLYASAYAGVLYCYDMKTGNVLWTYGNGGEGNTTYGGFEVPGHYPTFINAIGGHDLSDGVVYTVTTEHTFETPIYKGATTRAINATDGTEIYKLAAATGEFSAGSFAIADGYTNLFNSYDQRIYTLGRGPSETTVTAGPKSTTLANSVVIEGTVNDVSVGLQTTEIQGRFPTGVPVAADSSMTDWMAYVYQQQTKPTNFTGVNVHLIVLDGNGNYQDLGTTTTDTKGQYGMSWVPNVPGDFKVFAYFDGTNGYWPSSAETMFAVDAAAPTQAPPPTAAPPMVDQYFLPAIAGLFALIIIVAAVLAIMMRKRP